MHIQARYLTACESHVLDLGRKTAEQRVAHAIVGLHERLVRLGQGDDGTGCMPFPLTEEMLGDLTGLTPVHTNRILRRLRVDGVLVCERRRLRILDHGRLAEIARGQD